MYPANQLLLDRDPNEAYAAADKGYAYIVYFPTVGEVRLDVSETKGPLAMYWINISTGRLGAMQSTVGGNLISLSPPNNENWVVAIIQKND